MKPATLWPLILLLSCSPEPLTLTFGGDVGLARNTGKLVDREGPAHLLAAVRPLAIGGPFIANFEGALSDNPVPPQGRDRDLVLTAPRSRAEALRGLTALSLANNHSLDGGPAAWDETRRILREVGVQPLNGPGQLSWGPWTIRILAITEVVPVDVSPGGPVTVWTTAQVSDQVRSWHDQDPRQPVVVLVHWGQESSPYPSNAQRVKARTWIDAGADLVIGSHPHVWQPVEVRGRGLIAWSLGNLAFDSGGPEVRSSGLLRVLWSGDRGVEAWEILPLTLEGPGRRPEIGGQIPFLR